MRSSAGYDNMPSPTDIHVPGLFIYKDRSGTTQGLLFQFNPETLKRTRTVEFKDSDTNQPNGTTQGRGQEGRKYSIKANRWKIDFDFRLDASRTFTKMLGTVLAQRSAATQEFAGMSSVDSVLAALRQLEALVEPTALQVMKTKHGFDENADTPEIDFYWGDRVWKGYITSLSINETLFNVALIPMMVEASISMEIIETMSSLLANKVGGESAG